MYSYFGATGLQSWWVTFPGQIRDASPEPETPIMQSENEIKQYIQILVKEFAKTVLADERYKKGELDAAFIHHHYNVAVDKYLKNITVFESKKVEDEERLYYRGWIASHLAMSLNLERQELFEKERAQWVKERVKLEKEILRLTEKNEKLTDKMAELKEKAKRK